MGATDAVFYTVSDSRFFLGTVGLLNSLRLIGHHNELIVLDRGLRPDQRELLSRHCTLVQPPAELAANPMLSKPFPYMLNPTGTVVIIDSDIIVTRSLEPILTQANQGKICVFPDIFPWHRERWFAEWQHLFGLSDKPRRQTYVISGFVVFSTSYWPTLLRQWWHACERIPSQRTRRWGAPSADPLMNADQDALNALLMGEVPADAVILLPEEQQPPVNSKGLLVVDPRILLCRYRGGTAVLLHSVYLPKPWESRAWRVVKRNAYVLLLRRLLASSDVALRVPAENLPIWLRRGLGAELGMRALDGINRLKGLIRRRSRRRRGGNL